MKIWKQYQALRGQREFGKLVAADAVNRFGDSIDAIAMSLLMYEITGSAAMMSLVLGLNYLPNILLQPIFGVWVEKRNKRRIMFATDFARGAVVLMMAALYRMGHMNTGWLLAATLTLSTLEAFRLPAGTALTPQLLAREHYTVGASLRGGISRLMEIGGLALGGAVTAVLGIQGALAIDAATFLISGVLIAWIGVQEEKGGAVTNWNALKSGLNEGVRYLTGNSLLVAMFLLGMALNFCLVPVSSLGTAYLVEVLGHGAAFLSAVQLVQVAGMAVGSTVVPLLSRFKRWSLIVAAGLVGCLALAALGPAAVLAGWPRDAVVLAAMALLGARVGMQSVLYSAAFLEHVDQGFLARVGGLTDSLLYMAMPLGAFLCSALAASLSIPMVFAMAGGLMAAAYGVMCCLRVYRSL